MDIFLGNYLFLSKTGKFIEVNSYFFKGISMFNRIKLLIYFLNFFSRNSRMAILGINVWYSKVTKLTHNPDEIEINNLNY